MTRRPERRFAIRELAMRAKVDKPDNLTGAEKEAALAAVTREETREMLGRLKAIDVQVLARGEPSILESNSNKPNAKKFVREGRLLRADPEFFERYYPSREEFEESQRVVAMLLRKFNALAADYRDFKRRVIDGPRSSQK